MIAEHVLLLFNVNLFVFYLHIVDLWIIRADLVYKDCIFNLLFYKSEFPFSSGV